MYLLSRLQECFLIPQKQAYLHYERLSQLFRRFGEGFALRLEFLFLARRLQ